MKNLVNKLKKVNKIYVVLGIITSVILLNVIISVTTGNNVLKNATASVLRTFGFNTQVVESISLTSDGFKNNEPGSFDIEKSAKWIGENKAQITFDIDTILKTSENKKDIILVIDVSGSMEGEKLDKVKSDTKELTEVVLSDSDNKIALITFDTSSAIISEFTSDKDKMLTAIDSLTTAGVTNYYSALINAEKVLENYIKEKNRDLTLLFLTDGYPNEETPNELAQYELLKVKYPYININAIQYEMGLDIKEEVKVISDKQFTADITTLNNTLFEASINPEYYETFELTDYIDNEYFYVEKESDIKTSIGNATLTEENGVQKVIWKGPQTEFITGKTATITIDVKVKEDKIGKEGFFSSNEKAEVKVKTSNSDKETNKTTSTTPVLKAGYKVIYDSNTPKGCTQEAPATKTHYAYEKVKVSNKELKCNGYLFKGWEIVTKDVKNINDTTFEMPEKDVEVKAKWTSLSIKKSMNGTVYDGAKLYNTVASLAVLDNKSSEFVTASTGINYHATSSDTNGKGVYTYSDTKDDKYPVHFYRGDVNNNNVKFAGFCWKIVRTTDTGGTKLIYNGTPDANGDCTATTGEATQIGTGAFNTRDDLPAYNGYMYGEEYEVNKIEIDWRSRSGKTQQELFGVRGKSYYYSTDVTYSNGKYTLVNPEKKYFNDNWNNLQSNYTCLSETDTSCEKVAFIQERTSTNSSLLCTMMENGETEKGLKESLSNIVYGNDVTYDNETGMYKLENIILSKDYETIERDTEKEDGYHYTCLSEKDTCETIKYKIGYSGNGTTAKTYGHYIDITNGNKIEDIYINMKKNIKSSIVKTRLENWYENNLYRYSDYIEDTVWCNDRSSNDYGVWTHNQKNYIVYSALYRLYNSRYTAEIQGKPLLRCKDNNDNFTVSNIKGNGMLTHPIALLTTDEVVLAGGQIYTNSIKYYLNSNQNWWTMTPGSSSTTVLNQYITNTGSVSLLPTGTNYIAGIRPSMSLANDVVILEGNGTATDPYVITR